MADGGRHSADSALVVELASGATVRDAAKEARVSERTAYRRLENEEFRRQVGDLRRQMVDGATGRLAQAMGGAVAVLVTLAESAVSEAARVSAARAVVEFGIRLREAEEFEHRLSELEAAALAQRNGRR